MCKDPINCDYLLTYLKLKSVKDIWAPLFQLVADRNLEL